MTGSGSQILRLKMHRSQKITIIHMLINYCIFLQLTCSLVEYLLDCHQVVIRQLELVILDTSWTPSSRCECEHTSNLREEGGRGKGRGKEINFQFCISSIQPCYTTLYDNMKHTCVLKRLMQSNGHVPRSLLEPVSPVLSEGTATFTDMETDDTSRIHWPL